MEKQLKGTEELVNDIVDKVKEESNGVLRVAHRPPTRFFYGGDVEVDGSKVGILTWKKIYKNE